MGCVNLAPNGAGLCCPPVLRPRQVVSKALLGAELFYEDHWLLIRPYVKPFNSRNLSRWKPLSNGTQPFSFSILNYSFYLICQLFRFKFTLKTKKNPVFGLRRSFFEQLVFVIMTSVFRAVRLRCLALPSWSRTSFLIMTSVFVTTRF